MYLFYRYINSSAGLTIIQRFANVRVDNYTEKRMTEVAFRHIMELSLDFHSNKNSGEILQAVRNASALNELLNVVFFTFAPGIIDLVVATIYISQILDAYAAFIVFVVTISYFWISIKLTLWTSDIRRENRTTYREQNRRLYEPVSNWLTVAYFDRNDHERERLARVIDKYQSTWTRYNDMSTLVGAARQLNLMVGFSLISILAVWRISSGIG
jgi:ABC-type transport system involved in Fe-S cluster assembly fused permease/ATPase subunit